MVVLDILDPAAHNTTKRDLLRELEAVEKDLLEFRSMVDRLEAEVGKTRQLDQIIEARRAGDRLAGLEVRISQLRTGVEGMLRFWPTWVYRLRQRTQRSSSTQRGTGYP